MAFSLVDDAGAEYAACAHAALEDANKVLMDIEDRLSKLDAPHSAPLGPLVEELRKKIRAAQVECA